MVDPKLYGPFCKSLVHVFRNAVEHGIEDPDTRLLADQDDLANIRCLVRVGSDHINLCIEDDGRGMATDVLRDKAVEKGLLSVSEAQGRS